MNEAFSMEEQSTFVLLTMKKAFDRVDWSILMRAMKRLGIDWKDRNLIANLYLKQTAVVRIGEELSEEYDNDVRSPLSSLISTLRNWLEKLWRKHKKA